MRIGFFTDTFLPQRNGVVSSLLSFGSSLIEHGHEVSIFCPKSSLRETGGMKVYSYPAVRFRPYPEFRIAVPQGRDRVPELDLVHSHSPFTMGFFGNRVAKFQGIPRVGTFHTMLSDYLHYVFKVGSPLLKVFTWQLCRSFFNRQVRVIAPSRVIRRVLREHGVKRPIDIIPSGVDLRFYRPIGKQRARRELGLKAERVFLCLGRLSHEKNVDLIIRAMKRVEKGVLLVCGRGPALRSLRALARREGLHTRILFKGFVPERLKPYYYSAADALVMASTSETQGVVILEAMACGTPVIGARALAIPEIVKNEKNGFLFDPTDVDELSQILKSFSPSDRLRNQALRTARSFSKEAMTKKLEEFYSKVLG